MDSLEVVLTRRNETLADLGGTIEDLEAYVSHAREGQYLLITGITLLVYDWFCTCEEEWLYIWKERPRLVPAKIMFAINRYLPLMSVVCRFLAFNGALYNPDACQFALLSMSGFVGVIDVALVEIILMLRVWVLYGRKKWIGIVLWIFCISMFALALAVKYLQPHTSLPFVFAPTFGRTGCQKVVPAELFFLYGISSIVESVFFTMLVVKAYHVSRTGTHTPILTALLKQGSLYYFVVLVILAVTMFAPFSNHLYWPLANGMIIVPITSIACNRLVLSLRGLVFSRSVVGGSEFGLSDRSTGPATSTPPQYLHTARVYFAPVHPSLGNTNGYSDRNNRNLGPVSSGTGTGTSTTATAASANEEWIFRHGNLPPFSPLSPHSPSESIGRRSSLETHGVLGLGNGIGRGDALRRSSSGGGGRRDNGVIVISAASAASGLSAGASQSHSRMRSLPEEDDLEFGPMPIVNIRRKANHD